MVIQRKPPRHPRRGPSCLLVLFVLFGISVSFYAIQNRDEVREIIIPTATPEPTDTPTMTPRSTSTPVLAPTNTPEPTPGEGTPDPAATATVAALLTQQAGGTLVPTATALPDTGFADDVGVPGLLLITGVLMVIIILSRRLRTSSS